MASSENLNMPNELIKNLVRNMMGHERDPSKEVTVSGFKCVTCHGEFTFSVSAPVEMFMKSSISRSGNVVPIMCGLCFSGDPNQIHVHMKSDLIQTMISLTSEEMGRLFVVGSNLGGTDYSPVDVAVDMESVFKFCQAIIMIINKIEAKQELGPVARGVGLDGMQPTPSDQGDLRGEGAL
jgi:hypothetical protein